MFSTNNNKDNNNNNNNNNNKNNNSNNNDNNNDNNNNNNNGNNITTNILCLPLLQCIDTLVCDTIPLIRTLEISVMNEERMFLQWKEQRIYAKTLYDKQKEDYIAHQKRSEERRVGKEC